MTGTFFFSVIYLNPEARSTFVPMTPHFPYCICHPVLKLRVSCLPQGLGRLEQGPPCTQLAPGGSPRGATELLGWNNNMSICAKYPLVPIYYVLRSLIFGRF